MTLATQCFDPSSDGHGVTNRYRPQARVLPKLGRLDWPSGRSRNSVMTFVRVPIARRDREISAVDM